jgi:hypothetical protein
MARVTREMSEAWVKEAILVLDGAAPSRHFWSRWMDRALAPHAAQMTLRPAPIPANDVAPEEEDEEDAPRSGDSEEPGPPILRFD